MIAGRWYVLLAAIIMALVFAIMYIYVTFLYSIVSVHFFLCSSGIDQSDGMVDDTSIS